MTIHHPAVAAALAAIAAEAEAEAEHTRLIAAWHAATARLSELYNQVQDTTRQADDAARRDDLEAVEAYETRLRALERVIAMMTTQSREAQRVAERYAAEALPLARAESTRVRRQLAEAEASIAPGGSLVRQLDTDRERAAAAAKAVATTESYLADRRELIADAKAAKLL
jgi:DNA repair exonuclease SbcCD ATPase subunit